MREEKNRLGAWEDYPGDLIFYWNHDFTGRDQSYGKDEPLEHQEHPIDDGVREWADRFTRVRNWLDTLLPTVYSIDRETRDDLLFFLGVHAGEMIYVDRIPFEGGEEYIYTRDARKSDTIFLYLE